MGGRELTIFIALIGELRRLLADEGKLGKLISSASSIFDNPSVAKVGGVCMVSLLFCSIVCISSTSYWTVFSISRNGRSTTCGLISSSLCVCRFKEAIWYGSSASRCSIAILDFGVVSMACTLQLNSCCDGDYGKLGSMEGVSSIIS